MNIVIMLLLISILVLVHELGHFSIARLFGITVERFGFGLPFGPTLYETMWGKTKICVHAFLLGGYVSFPDDDPDSEVPKDDPGRISNRPVWQRVLVVIAGVTANAILAYLIVLLVAGLYGGVPSGKYNVFAAGIQKDKNPLVSRVGIEKGDKIVTANGTIIDSPMKFIEIAQRSKKFDNYVTNKDINKQIDRLRDNNPSLFDKYKPDSVLPKNTQVFLSSQFYENPITLEKGTLPGVVKYKPEGEKLSEKQIKLRDGLADKTSFVSDGHTSLYDLAAARADNVHPITIVVNRKDQNIKLFPAYPNQSGIIGIKLSSEEIIIPVKGPISAIAGAWHYLVKNTYYMLGGLVLVISGQIPIGDLHGIVAITKVGSDIIAKKGILDGLLLTALISMDLAIVNLLPIPALDGGHLMFLLIEKLRGRPIKQETQESIAKFGFIFLIGLMVFIIFNDIYALVMDKL